MFFVYILQSLKDNSYYVGYTGSIERRLSEHNSGKSKYTKGHIPYILICCITISSKQEAKKLEKKIKTQGIKRYLKSAGSHESSIHD